MKKLFVIILASGLILALSSCKKDFTCECTYTVAGTTTTIPYEYEDIKKSDAEDVCNTQETLYKLTDANASCEIK